MKIYPRLHANVIFRGQIECLTGLHIGGSTDKLEIGGLDSPVIRDPHTKEPYIPGSSLKGKMRHLLELATGSVGNPVGDKPGNVSKAPIIASIFGLGADDVPDLKNADDLNLSDLNLTRLIVRDAYPDRETVKMWEEAETELQYTETKAENTIDRLTSAANPRFVERVLAKSKFNFEMVYSIYLLEGDESRKQEAIDKANQDLRNVMLAMRLLEASALGKSGSRGYGRIRFHLADPVLVDIDQYRENGQKYKDSTASIKGQQLKQLNEIKPPQYSI